MEHVSCVRRREYSPSVEKKNHSKFFGFQLFLPLAVFTALASDLSATTHAELTTLQDPAILQGKLFREVPARRATSLMASASDASRAESLSHDAAKALPTGRASAEESANTRPQMIPGEILVKFRPNVARSKQAAILKSFASQVNYFERPTLTRPGLLNSPSSPAAPSILDQLARIKIDPSLDQESAILRVQKNPDVLYAEPNFLYHIAQTTPTQITPDDFDLSKSWALHNTGQSGGTNGADIHAFEAWKLATGDRRVVVAVLDTGVDYYHPDLAENIWTNSREIPGNGIDDDHNGYVDDVHGYDFVSNDSDPMDDHSHGTHVSGIIGAVGNNKLGASGVCWQVSIMAVKAFDETGDADVAHVLEAIRYAIDNGAQIINASWGGANRSRALEDIVAEANQAGVLFVAAAGNERTDTLFYPAAYTSVIAVAATDSKDQRAPFSNFGSHVDVAAPGENIFSTLPNSNFDFISGTSMAAPHVAGLAALIKSKHPAFNNREIENIIRNTTDPIATDKYIGTGRINAYRALLVDSPLPVAKLNVPGVLSGNVQITGSARGSNFVSYVLEYGKGNNPTNWTRFYSSTIPVNDGKLLDDLATAGLDEGIYTIKLIANNAAGQPAIDRSVVEVRNVSISFPMNNDILRAGETIAIHGTVFGPGRTYTVEYGIGWQPTVWLNKGITLINDGKAEALNSTLATWDTRVVSTNEFFSLKLTARVSGQIIGEHIVHMVYLDGHLKAGWPQYIPIVGEFPPEDWRDVQVADIDHDGFDELVLVDHGNNDGKKARLLVYNHDGTLRWSKELAVGAPYADIPLVGDLDNDGLLEIFVDVGDKGELFAFKSDGTALTGNWPIRLETTNLGKVMADLDGDGVKEIVAYTQSPIEGDGTTSRRLFVINRDGTILRKWEIPSCSRTLDLPKMFPAVGNLDADRELEIVVVSGCNEIAAYKLSKETGPLWTAKTEGTLLASPVIGDLDHDGANEIVIGAYKSQPTSPGGLYAFNNQGQLLPGWPVLLEESFSSAAALADFDRDGDLEISIPSAESQKIYLLHHNGFAAQGWPVGPITSSFIKTSTVIGDVNNDGELDVVISSPGYWFLTLTSGDLSSVGGIKAWSFDGSEINMNGNGGIYPLPMESSAGKSFLKSAPITLSDIDHDGKLDIIAASIQDRAYAPLGQPSPRKNRSSLYVWELDVPFEPEKMPWPTFQGSSEHTGLYKPPPHKNLPPVVSDLPDQTIRPGASFFSVELDQYVEDPDHQSKEISWSVVGNSQFKISIDADHIATIMPPSATWTGKETVQFVATDPGGLRSSDSVVLEVRANYDPPVAREDFAITLEDTPIEIDSVANDTDPDGDPLTISTVSKPRVGTVKRTPLGKLIYTPAADFNGNDKFSYIINDGKGGVAIGVVRVEIVPVNDNPVAVADRVITSEDTPVRIDALANDRDPDGDTMSLVEFTQPANGSVSAHPGGGFLYTPKPDFFGLDSFGYKIRDTHNTEGTNTVTVMVKPVNDPPVAKDQTFSLNRRSYLTLDFLALDADGDKLTFSVIKSPEHGVLLAYPTVAEYGPNKEFVGTDSFTYKANDGQIDSEVVTVFLEVRNGNNPPTVDSQTLATKREQPFKITMTAKDADDDTLTFQIVEPPSKGSLIGEGAIATYQPKPGFIGFDEFRFTAADGKSRSDVGTVIIQVTDLNSAPVAKDSSVTTKMNIATNVVLQALDGEANPLNYIILTGPKNGRLTGIAPNLIYTPDTNYTGSDRFNFQVNDGEFDSSVAIVAIVVKFPNNPPEPKEQSITVPMNQPFSISLNVVDPDGDAMQSAILKGPKNGRLTGRGTNFIYTPKPGFSGTDTFTYKAWDGHIYGIVGKVTLKVTSDGIEPRLAIQSVARLANGETRLILRTQPGKPFSLQVSTNLVDWVSLLSKIADSTTTSFVDTNATSFTSRFYRAAEF